jgi:hypothetical protein
MKAIEFSEMNTRIAEKQDEYETLPARIYDDPFGEVISCWQLTDEEIDKIKETKCIWLSMLTFRKGIAPVMMFAEKPEMEERRLGFENGNIVPIPYAILYFKPLIISFFSCSFFSSLFQAVISKAHKVLFYSRILFDIDFQARESCNKV